MLINEINILFSQSKFIWDMWMHTHTHTHTYTQTYIWPLSLVLSLSLSLSIYICVCVCVEGGGRYRQRLFEKSVCGNITQYVSGENIEMELYLKP